MLITITSTHETFHRTFDSIHFHSSIKKNMSNDNFYKNVYNHTQTYMKISRKQRLTKTIWYINKYLSKIINFEISITNDDCEIINDQ